MKLVFIIFLAVLAITLGFSVSSLQKELLAVRNNSVFYEKRSDDLQGELMRINMAYDENEGVLNKIKQSITELESKVDMEKLERYIPQETWNEIKPIIDRLKAFQETRENNNLSKEYEEDN